VAEDRGQIIFTGAVAAGQTEPLAWGGTTFNKLMKEIRSEERTVQGLNVVTAGFVAQRSIDNMLN
jgi:hypothetical protein